MRRALTTITVPGLLLLLLGAGPAGGAGGSRLDAVQDAVLAKGIEIGLGTKPATPPRRALAAALGRLERPRDGILDDLRAAVPVSRILDRAFPGDPLLDPALAGALAVLREDLHGEQVAMLTWTGRTGSDRGERLLQRGVFRLADRLARADGAASRVERARFLLAACRIVHRTRKGIDLPAPRFDPAPFAGTAPDFSLEDRNPGSATSGLPVSPRDHLGNVTAWYFLRST